MFKTNLNTQINQYSHRGVRIFRTNKGRFVIFNSKFATMRILAPRKRKVLARLTMFEKKDKQGNMDYISSFGIDDKNRVAWFSYLMDTNIHIYSFG